MKVFVDWLFARRYRLILLAAAMAPLLQLVTIALMAVETLRRGVTQSLVGAALGIFGLVAIAGIAGSNSTLIGTVALIAFGAGIGLGWLLRWTGGLALAFQAMVLLSVVAVVAVSVVGPGPEVLFAPMLDQLVEILRESGGTDQQIEIFRETQPIMFGLFAAVMMAQLVAALFLAYWLNGTASGDSSFGTEFRGLQLSRSLGIPAAVLVAVGLVLNTPLVQNLAPLALFAFVFQGLAVLHAWAHARQWHVGIVVPVYVLLVTPMVGFILLGLSAVGLVDNWFDLRAPLRSQT